MGYKCITFKFGSNGLFDFMHYSIIQLFHYSLKVFSCRVLSFILIILIFPNLTNAQSDNFNLDFKAVVKSNDGIHNLVLFHRGELNSSFEGYILITRGNHNINGRIKKGGFSFLDPKIFEIGVPSLRQSWVKNNFPLQNLTSLTNGVDVEKVYSFEVTPEVLNLKSDSISFFIKGVFYNLVKQNDKSSEFNLNYDINLSYRLFKVPLDKFVSLKFFNGKFDNYKFSVEFKKIKKSDECLATNNRPLLEGIKKSVEGSTLPRNVLFNLGAEYIRTNADDPYQDVTFSPYKFFLRDQQYSLIPVNTLKDKTIDETNNLPLDIYKAGLTFPFKIYNKKKEELYKNYSSKKRIFKSNFNIVVVPIALNEDTLTADVFLNYTEINLNDNIPRWTPIRKRIKLLQGYPTAIKLPKENWSANFTRDGNKYAIYGYSDFEKYVNQYIIISFDSVKQIEKD